MLHAMLQQRNMLQMRWHQLTPTTRFGFVACLVVLSFALETPPTIIPHSTATQIAQGCAMHDQVLYIGSDAYWRPWVISHGQPRTIISAVITDTIPQFTRIGFKTGWWNKDDIILTSVQSIRCVAQHIPT
jgi:hypothetical protein